MKKVLGASLGVLAITFMSFASPQENSIKANDAQVVSEQTSNELNKDLAGTKTTLHKALVTNTVIKTITKDVITTKNQAKSAQFNDVMEKYLK